MAATKVYISSTYRDLREHRAQLVAFFQKLPEHFSLVSMEGYVAENKTPLQKCLDDVAESELYILILANRYGFIIDDPVVNPNALSVTEMEYRAALQGGQRRVLAFIVDSKADFPKDINENGEVIEVSQTKLEDFKTDVKTRLLTHPEGFVSAHHLALQVSESLMKSKYISRMVDDARRYCCDRGQQFGSYLSIQTTSRFKTIIIHGDSKELGLNFINRLGIFILNLTESDITPPFSFEDLLTSNNYEICRNALLMKLHFKYFQNKQLDDLSTMGFLKAVATLNKPLALTVSCDEENFNTQQKAFLVKFLEEFYLGTTQVTGKSIYLFLYLEEYDDDEADTARRIEELKSKLPQANQYCFEVPRLNKLRTREIKNWMLEYVSSDEGIVEELLDEMEFADLPASFTMKEANNRLRRFIKRLNNKDEKLMKIIE